MLLRSTCVKAESVPLLTSCPPRLWADFSSTIDLATQFHWAGNVEFMEGCGWWIGAHFRSQESRIRVHKSMLEPHDASRRQLRHCTAPVSGTKSHTGLRHRSKPHLHLSLFCLSLATAVPRINNHNLQLPHHPHPHPAIEHESVHVKPLKIFWGGYTLSFLLKHPSQDKMANSPLVVPGSGEKGNANRTKLSNTAAASNGATPEASNTSSGGGHDLAEQMNEEEKQKYVKG
jgi:hypothetical protein